MTEDADDQPRLTDKVIEDRRVIELPGTIDCLSIYFLTAILGFCAAVPFPYCVLFALAMTVVYVVLIAMFGQSLTERLRQIRTLSMTP